jgi:capsular exopolysaccharide synthesis family protein
MGRIDDALRRTSGQDEPRTPGNQAGGSDAFSSPWDFDDRQASGQAAAPEPPRTPAITIERVTSGADTVAQPTTTTSYVGNLGVFTGFDPASEDKLVVGPNANNALVEQFRKLAATLHQMQLVRGLKTLLITSALPTDGKTLTATNIALTLSESYRRRVLLIDADLRRPALHQIFRVPNAAGLNEGLKAKGDGRLSVLKISDTLTLLPAGRPEPDPMSGLTSARMANIIEEAATRFDWVLVDTPPIGLLADANLLSVMTDGALLVIRANQTPHASVLKAVQALGRERILGVVLNGTESLGREAEYSQYYAPVVPPATR